MRRSALAERSCLTVITILTTLGMLALPGCLNHHHHPAREAKATKSETPGPPPWAPAHGHRRKHQHGAELVFDSEIGVHVVVGYPGHYWDGHRYYRHSNGSWQITIDLRDGSWVAVDFSKVPPGLRSKHPKKHGKKTKKPGRGHGPPARRAD